MRWLLFFLVLATSKIATAQGKFDRYLSLYGNAHRSTVLFEGSVNAVRVQHINGNGFRPALSANAHYQVTPFVSGFVGLGFYNHGLPISEFVTEEIRANIPNRAGSFSVGVRHTLFSIYPYEKYRRKLNFAAIASYERLFSFSDSTVEAAKFSNTGYVNYGVEAQYYLSDNMFVHARYLRRTDFIQTPQAGFLGDTYSIGINFRPVREYTYKAFLRSKK